MKNLLTTVLLFSISKVCICQRIHPADYLVNATVKIETVDKVTNIAGRQVLYGGSGTGFFFNFRTSKGIIPAIVTNKHVIKEALRVSIAVSDADTNGLPIYGKMEKITLNRKDLYIIYHPDTTVDLAIILFNPILNFFSVKGKKLSYLPLDESLIPSDSSIRELSAIEDLYMIGYPFGLKDEMNNSAITRRGITATPYALDYSNKKEFLADIPVYPGSSGSPIVAYSNGFLSKTGGYHMSLRIFLLGINYATYQQDFTGKIIPKATFNITDSVEVQTKIPYNIGIIIKSQRILEFKPILEKIK
jgi:hypothetical protein